MINLTLIVSDLQIVAGIPQSITLVSNVPSSIFYTLDGTDPTLDSLIYVSAVKLPTDQGTVIIKAWATDGTDTSEILSQTYAGNIMDIRRGHNQVYGIDSQAQNRHNNYPFGDPFQLVPAQFGPMAGIVVDAPGVAGFPDGYDGTGTGTPAGKTDLPLSEYEFIFSTTNSNGERGHGIGTLPAQTVIIPPPGPPQSSSDINSRFFNPKALVIYQDSRDEPLDPRISQLNRQFFSLEDPEKVRTGALLFTTAFDGLQTTGSLVRQSYNPRDDTITYAYRDSGTNRWIFSIEPYVRKSPTQDDLSGITRSTRSEGAGFVYKWLPFAGRALI